ncbi:MAG: hypothetical protein AB8I08_34965 [Sandaracinaceae bacterium]
MPSRRDLILGVVPLLGAALAPRTAAADIAGYPPARRPARQPVLALDGVHVVRRDAPDVDVELVHQQATLAISRQRGRIASCIRGLDLRRDPNRSGAREMSVRLIFNRSGRPTVRPLRGSFPTGAVLCVHEAMRAINIRAVPQGRVAVEARYSLR